ncbi:MAG: hypothetical protein IPH08_16105 [Rhodocyclaceae bacterium]|nr:hypothetical protein [Rhodocyclaceae bacterium]
MANVVFKINLGVVDPIGAIQIKRHLDQPATKYRRYIQTLTHMRHDVTQAYPATGRGTRIVDAQHGDVHALIGALQREIEFVETGKLLHEVVPSAILKTF